MTSQDQKLNKLELIIKMMDESITKEDFIKSFENVVNLVKQIKAQNETEIATMQETIQLLTDKLTARVDAKLATVRDAIPGKDGKDGKNGLNGNDGQDGADADEAIIVQDVLARIPKTDLTPIWEALQEKLDEFDKKISAASPKPSTAPFYFGSGKTRIILIDLSSQLNGVLTKFYLGTHQGIISVQSDSSPFGAFRDVIDYNESGKYIQFTANVDPTISLATGHSLIVKVLR